MPLYISGANPDWSYETHSLHNPMKFHQLDDDDSAFHFIIQLHVWYVSEFCRKGSILRKELPELSEILPTLRSCIEAVNINSAEYCTWVQQCNTSYYCNVTRVCLYFLSTFFASTIVIIFTCNLKISDRFLDTWLFCMEYVGPAVTF